MLLPPATPVMLPPPATPVMLLPPATPVMLPPPATPVMLLPPATPVMLPPPATPVMLLPPATPVILRPAATPVMLLPPATPVILRPAATPVMLLPPATPVMFRLIAIEILLLYVPSIGWVRIAEVVAVAICVAPTLTTVSTFASKFFACAIPAVATSASDAIPSIFFISLAPSFPNINSPVHQQSVDGLPRLQGQLQHNQPCNSNQCSHGSIDPSSFAGAVPSPSSSKKKTPTP